jgi:phosphoribosylanthranilate isomerase
MTPPPERIQVKICGLTRPAEAAACAAAGADAIGCVFYPRSKRHVTPEQAREIASALAGTAVLVGLFVDEPLQRMIRTAHAAGLDMLQLHGHEGPEVVSQLEAEGLPVIKALFSGGTPPLADAARYPSAALLVECAGGPLPGGNALAWDWSRARELSRRYPLVLAGGLDAANVPAAIAAACPAAVDVSSGVETAPGRKDLAKVRAFIAAVAKATPSGMQRPFRRRSEASQRSVPF